MFFTRSVLKVLKNRGSLFFQILISFPVLWFSGCITLFAPDDSSIVDPQVMTIHLPHQCHANTSFDLNKPWWLVYGDDHLNELVVQVISENNSLNSAWERLKQSRAFSRIAAAQQFPEININGSGSRIRSKSSVPLSADTSTEITTYQNFFDIGPNLSYEVDLWNRVGASVDSGKMLAEATRADVENTILILSGRTTELWFRAQKQEAILKLLTEQIDVAQRLLQLVKIRFQVGRSSALDVYQQERFLSALKADVPLQESIQKQLKNQIAVLSGQAPQKFSLTQFSGVVPSLPQFPALESPISLLESRPDLRALRSRLKAAKLDIDVAIAGKFPTLGISLGYNFSAKDITDLITGQVGRAVSTLFLPLIDSGRREATIEAQTANWRSLESTVKESVLIAMQDIENAIVEEQALVKHIELSDKQLQYAQATLRESQTRYLNGLADYLQVTLALQSVQSIQRAQLENKTNLILARNRLYLALGGTWTQAINNPEKQSV